MIREEVGGGKYREEWCGGVLDRSIHKDRGGGQRNRSAILGISVKHAAISESNI